MEYEMALQCCTGFVPSWPYGSRNVRTEMTFIQNVFKLKVHSFGCATKYMIVEPGDGVYICLGYDRNIGYDSDILEDR
jgi:hypothetical protein